MSNKPIPIIDLFAGPGGLGEGFTSVVDSNNGRHFTIALSIEKDEHAHQTLTLRSFVRQFPYKQLPPEYYQFLRGELKDVEELYNLYPQEAEHAKKEAWRFELGKSETHSLIDKRIKKALKGEKNFVLIGGPPCQAYSLVGRARRQEAEGLNKEDERVYLYREYYRILAVHRPPVFVMENVKGILSSKVENENIFKQIINDLKDPIMAYKKLKGQEKFYKSSIGYTIYSLVKPSLFCNDLFETNSINEPKDFIVKAEDYGVPQTRHRVILLGIRSDINIIPNLLKPSTQQIPIRKIICGLPPLRSGLSKMKDGKQEWKQVLEEIKQSNLREEISDDIWYEMLAIVDNINIPTKDKGALFVGGNVTIDYMPDWYLDENLKGVCNYESRTHIKEDIYRYLFASCFAKIKKRSPKLSDFPASLLPLHLNVGGRKIFRQV